MRNELLVRAAMAPMLIDWEASETGHDREGAEQEGEDSLAERSGFPGKS